MKKFGRRGPTYQRSNAQLKRPYGLSADRVAHGEQEKNVGGRYEHTCPDFELREEHDERHGRAEQFCEVRADDGDFREGIQRVKYAPAPEQGVAWTIMEEQTAVGGKVCVGRSQC